MHTMNVTKEHEGQVRTIFQSNNIPFIVWDEPDTYSVISSNETIPSKVAEEIDALCVDSGTRWDSSKIAWEPGQQLKFMVIDIDDGEGE